MKKINFTDEMIKAISDGVKTQSRRPIKDKTVFLSTVVSVNLSTNKRKIALHDNNGNNFYAKEKAKYKINETIKVKKKKIYLKITDIRIQQDGEYNFVWVYEFERVYPKTGAKIA